MCITGSGIIVLFLKSLGQTDSRLFKHIIFKSVVDSRCWNHMTPPHWYVKSIWFPVDFVSTWSQHFPCFWNTEPVRSLLSPSLDTPKHMHSLRNWWGVFVVYFPLCFAFRKVRDTTARKQNLGRKRKRWGRGEGRGRCRFLFRPCFSIRAAVTQLLLCEPRRKNTHKNNRQLRGLTYSLHSRCAMILTHNSWLSRKYLDQLTW